MILEERIGDDFKVNWQLGVHDVTPTKDAFRNLHLRGLISQASGKLGKTHIIKNLIKSHQIQQKPCMLNQTMPLFLQKKSMNKLLKAYPNFNRIANVI